MTDNCTRLTYLISSLEMGGAERGMTRILSGLSSEYDVTVVALRGGDQTVVSGIPEDVDVLDLAIESPRDLGGLRLLSQTVSETDVLVCSLYHAVILGSLFALLWRVPATLVWQHNETFGSPTRRRLFGVAARRSDLVLADSTPVATVLRENFPSVRDKVRTVPIAGIDSAEFTPVSHESTGETVVGILGTLTEQKNHDAVLAAAERLRGEPIRFVVAGDGPRRAELTQTASERDLPVEFRGYVEDPVAFLNTLDVYVQPSHHEGLCLTTLEAMACGLPVVATPVGGLAETVVDGETGYHVPVGDVEAFTDAIRRLHDSPERRATFGDAGRRRVQENYSREVLIEGFQHAVESALATERSRRAP